MDTGDVFDFAAELAQALFPLLPIDQGKKLIEEILAAEVGNGVDVLSEEELDAFQRRELQLQKLPPLPEDD